MRGDPTVVLVIPARFASSRFPGKALSLLAGKPVIQHAYERASASSQIDEILVATDDARIVQVVQGFGGRAVMTDGTVRTGTDRVAAVARERRGSIFVNLQADEIPLHPNLVADLVVQFRASGAGMGTLMRRLPVDHNLGDPSIVKVVTTPQGEALYFSRAPIPYERDGEGRGVVPGLHYVHLGVYIYTRETLLHLAGLPTGRLEEAEKLEQLRALEHGVAIRVWETTYPSLRIDRPEDLNAAAALLQSCAA